MKNFIVVVSFTVFVTKPFENIFQTESSNPYGKYLLIVNNTNATCMEVFSRVFFIVEFEQVLKALVLS